MDTGDWTLLSLWVHVPLVTVWIGLVMWDVFTGIAPGLSTDQRGRMIAWSRPFVIGAIIVIMVTGVWQTMQNPYDITIDSYAGLSELRGNTYGLALFWKHGFVLGTFALTLLVRFLLAPRLVMRPLAVSAADGGASTATVQLERTVLWLSVLNLAMCLGALVMATRMIWELH